jgi:tRNA threonylcarbamoyladenosine modification (KEOPS) complex  Pcc1 subunit
MVQVGDNIGKYTIVRQLQEADQGTGVVWVATKEGVEYAFKILKEDFRDADKDEFDKTVKALAKLKSKNHAAIVKIEDEGVYPTEVAGESKDLPYYTTVLMEKNLEQTIRGHYNVGRREATGMRKKAEDLSWMRQSLEVLLRLLDAIETIDGEQNASGENYFCGDIKPSNILVNFKDEEISEIKLTDMFREEGSRTVVEGYYPAMSSRKRLLDDGRTEQEFDLNAWKAIARYMLTGFDDDDRRLDGMTSNEHLLASNPSLEGGIIDVITSGFDEGNLKKNFLQAIRNTNRFTVEEGKNGKYMVRTKLQDLEKQYGNVPSAIVVPETLPTYNEPTLKQGVDQPEQEGVIPVHYIIHKPDEKKTPVDIAKFKIAYRACLTSVEGRDKLRKQVDISTLAMVKKHLDWCKGQVTGYGALEAHAEAAEKALQKDKTRFGKTKKAYSDAVTELEAFRKEISGE